MKTPEYFCYTDGSCKKTESTPGGWGLFVKCPDGREIEKFGWALKTTVIAMELTAVLEAMTVVPPGAAATVFCDSKAVLDYCAKWLPIWRGNNWKNCDPANLGLFKNIDSLITQKALSITWNWVRGHNGNEGNERADDLAARGAREAKDRVKAT